MVRLSKALGMINGFINKASLVAGDVNKIGQRAYKDYNQEVINFMNAAPDRENYN